MEKPSNGPGREICEGCQKIFIGENVSTALSSKSGIHYKRQRSSIVHSALAGCQMCRELLCIPYDYNPGGYIKTQIRDHYNQSLANWPLDLWTSVVEEQSAGFFGTLFDPELRFEFRAEREPLDMIKVDCHQFLKSSKNLMFEISAREEDPVAALVANRTINLDVSCDRTYEKIRNWLKTCDTKHTTCYHRHSMSQKVRPSLVLDVTVSQSNPEKINLHRTDGLVIAYAALSYCWGAPQPNSSSKFNIETYLKAINLSSLPQTLQDAVIVTRKLGLQYLWVDSLCIVQDSEDDKNHELGNMDAIYRNAHITIVASCALNCNEGFLGLREECKQFITLPFRAGSGQIGEVSLAATQGPGVKDYKTVDEPIKFRAWTFQESFMSRRMLIYGKYQLFWVCRGTWGKDGGRMARKEYFVNELSSQQLMSPKFSDWIGILQEYYSRDLTDPSDKFPALSSIAKYFADSLKDRYVAGMWASKLHHHLCWIFAHSKDRFNRRKSLGLQRPPSWRAPSWSFMSGDGYFGIMEQKELNFEPRHLGNNLGCTIIFCNVVPISQQASFGRLASASIKLRGRILELAHDLSSIQQSTRQSTWGFPMKAQTTSAAVEIGTMHFDTVEYLEGCKAGLKIYTSRGELDLSAPLFCLMLCTKAHIVMPERKTPSRYIPNPYYQWRPWGILLSRIPDGNYHRIGYFDGTLASLSNFNKIQPEDIIIL